MSKIKTIKKVEQHCGGKLCGHCPSCTYIVSIQMQTMTPDERIAYWRERIKIEGLTKEQVQVLFGDVEWMRGKDLNYLYE